MLSPLVSIICNCYNHEKFIIEAIQSIENQSYKNIEIIVLNNGSTDNSDRIICKFLEDKPNIKYVNWEETQPITIAFNRIVELVKGDYLIDLAGDDILLPHCVETQINVFLKSDENVGIVYGNSYDIDEQGNILSTYFDVDSDGKVIDENLFDVNYLKLLGGGVMICSVSSMMKRSQFELLGGYDETLFFEDLDYWFRLSRRYKIRFVDVFLVKKRVVAHSLGTQIGERDILTKKLHSSLYKIFNNAIDCNNRAENKKLLERIHNNIILSLKNRLWRELARYGYLELKCRWKIIRQK